ncbi:hypothetical protein ACFYXM_29275 [Streptomyces sp. NPDC002476]|uniref:hypothetical protein n=1 Tax=Streptomyces sp. NPDC002476 TaxID=3364648 RepID=UPI003692A78D
MAGVVAAPLGLGVGRPSEAIQPSSRAERGQRIQVLFRHYGKFLAEARHHTNRLTEDSMRRWDEREDAAEGRQLGLGPEMPRNTKANVDVFGRPPRSGRGEQNVGCPQLRMVGLVECGSHAVFDAAVGALRAGEQTLARAVLVSLRPGMLLLADRVFYGVDLWCKAAATGADLLWRVRKDLVLPVVEQLPDCSYLARTLQSDPDPQACDPLARKPSQLARRCWGSPWIVPRGPCAEAIGALMHASRGVR